MKKFPDETLTEIKLHLENEEIRLTRSIAELSIQDPFSDSERTNNNAASDTEASEESNHDRVAALVDELKTKLEEVQKAHAKITGGTYGFCEVCGEMIDTDRLAILPTATLCLTHEKERHSHTV